MLSQTGVSLYISPLMRERELLLQLDSIIEWNGWAKCQRASDKVKSFDKTPKEWNKPEKVAYLPNWGGHFPFGNNLHLLQMYLQTLLVGDYAERFEVIIHKRTLPRWSIQLIVSKRLLRTSWMWRNCASRVSEKTSVSSIYTTES